MIKRIHHLVVYVKHMEKSIKFYTQNLGFVLEYQSEHWSVIRLGKQEVYIGLHLVESEIEGGTEIAFAVDDIQKTKEDLESKGIVFTRDILEIAPNMFLANFVDLDNNSLSIHQSNLQIYFKFKFNKVLDTKHNGIVF